jgi:hypothetical protein
MALMLDEKRLIGHLQNDAKPCTSKTHKPIRNGWSLSVLNTGKRWLGGKQTRF